MTIKNIADLTPDKENARSHNPRNVGMIVDALHEVGAARSIVIDEDGLILAGNATIEAAAVAGIERVQVVDVDGETVVAVRRSGLTAEQKKRLAYFDNRTAELADWNPDQLLADLEGGLDLSGLFGKDELDELLKGLAPEPPEDKGPQIDRGAELAELYGVATGQIWQLGDHRLAVGDCTDRVVVEAVMRGERAEAVVTDPPYNMAYSSRGSNKDHWGRIEGDDMPEAEFYEWLLAVAGTLDYALEPGASIYLCHRDTGRKSVPFIDVFAAVNWTRSATKIWAKQVASMGWQDYRSQHECLSYGWKNGAHRYFIDDRSQTTVWQIDRDAQEQYQHPTQKPVALFERAIKNSTRQDAIVADWFIGSGTAVVACERLDRRCRAIEIEPKYCAVTIQRYVDMTGGEPRLIE